MLGSGYFTNRKSANFNYFHGTLHLKIFKDFFSLKKRRI